MAEIKQVDYVDTFEVFIRSSTLELNIMPEDLNELWFVEDIYSFVMKGKLSFIDKSGLVEFGGLSGTETVSIIYGQEDNKKLALFHTHNTKTSLVNKSEYRIETELIAVEFKSLNYHTYSLSWATDTKYTDIIKDIVKKYLEIDEWEQSEDCKEKIPYFDTDNGTPAENIKWLMRRCSGTLSGQPGYLMYQNTSEKQWNLVTLESLLTQKKHYINDKTEMYVFKDVSSSYIHKIQSHKIKSPSNKFLPDLSRGYLLGYDPMTKVFFHQTYNYLQAVDKFTILGKHTLFENFQVVPYMNTEASPINTGETDLGVMDNLWYGQWIKRYCLQQLVEINVKGHEERYAGGLIEVVWKSADELNEKINQSMNGKYLIKSITHHFSHQRSPKYQQSLVLIKNGFGEKQEGSFIKAKKMNI